MAKKPTPNLRSLEQLRSEVWQDQASAVKDLKRNGLAVRGEDYELRETDTGSWQIMELGPDASEPVVKPKPAAQSKSAKSAKKAPATDPAPPAPEPAPVVTLFPDKADEPDPAEQHVPPPPAKGTDLSPLPSMTQAHYGFRIMAADVRQNGSVTQALELSKLGKVPVWITGPDGALLRLIDYAACMALKKTVPGAKRPAMPRAEGAPRSNPKADSLDAKTVKTLTDKALKKPLTSAEVRAITGWTDPKMSIRNALTAIAGKAGNMTLQATPDPEANRLLWSFVRN